MIYLWKLTLYPNKMSQVSSSKTLTLHLPMIHLQKDLLDIMEKHWLKRTIISFTPDQIKFYIFLSYFLLPLPLMLCLSLLLQLLISVQQTWQWDQSQSPGINSMPTFSHWPTRSSPPPVLHITQQSQENLSVLTL